MPTDLKAKFAKAAKEVNDLDERPADKDLLELYALYKQATVGDVTGTRPGARWSGAPRPSCPAPSAPAHHRRRA